MLSRIFWIGPLASGSLAILGRPQADRLVDEIATWRAAGIRTIVSLLEPTEANELGLGKEAEGCANAGVEFVAFPIPDRGVPEAMADAAALCDAIAARLQRGERVGIHCRSGIGRSAVIAACVLTRLGYSAEAALAMIAAARGTRVPDAAEQENWIGRFQRHHGAP
jgi:protein-tyrosine phosphatase